MTSRSSNPAGSRRSGGVRPKPRSAVGGSSAARFPWTLALGGAAVLLGVALLAAFTTAGSRATPSGRATPLPATSATVGAGALPAFATTADDPAIGQVIPEVRGSDFDGTDVAIARDRRPKVLLFVAHWCPHCQAEVPVVQAWLDAGRLAPSVDLISVATGIDPALPNYPPEAWLERERWSAPVLVDGSGTVAERFGLSAFPYWVAVDREGKVVARATGELSPEQIDAIVAAASR